MNTRPIVLAWFLLLCAVSPGAGHAEGTVRGESLDILVYGASGKVGRHIVDEALARGHRVTGVSRDPGRITLKHERYAVVQGDLLDIGSVQERTRGRDVVVVSVRGVLEGAESAGDAISRIGVENVVEAIRDSGELSTYLVHVGGAGSLEIKPGVLLADRVPKIFMPKDFEVELAGQVQALEYLRGVNDVAWTYATPPRTFTSGKRTGVFRIGGDRLMEDSRGKSRVSRADFAVAVVDEAESHKYQGKRFSVAY